VPTKGAVLNFDLGDLQKEAKSKTQVFCHVSLLDVPMIKIWEMIQPLVEES
jgi:hypothetical protein